MAGYLGSKAAFLSTTTANVTGDSTIGGNIIVGGTVDGRDIAADGALIDGLNALTTTQNLYSGDDSTVNFTLPFAPVDVNGISVYVDGVHQDSNSISTTGTALIFAEAPPTGTDNIVVRMVATGVTNFTTATNVVAKKEYATVALLLADTTDGTFFNTGDYVTVVEGGFSYKVATVGDVTNAGGIQFDVLAVNNIYPMLALAPNADGTTDDKAKIDLLNQSGFILDLGGKTYEYGGVFVAAATFVNGKIIDDNRTYDFLVSTAETSVAVPLAGIAHSTYFSATQIETSLPEKLVMSGMWFLGNWEKTSGAVKLSGATNGKKLISVTTDLAYITAQQSNCWYGKFAVANDEDDTVSYVCIPFMRALSVAGSVITLGKGGWNQRSDNITAETFTMATDVMAGASCVVIGEAGRWAGRKTGITANTATTVTLDTIGSITALDYILPLPSEDEYVYLGAHYIEGSEPKNMAYSGKTVLSSMTSVSGVRATGAYDPQEEVEMAGNVPPTATAIIININASINSATAGGGVAQYIYHDSGGHEVFWSYDFNAGITNWPLYYPKQELNFSSAYQSLYYKTAGSHDGVLSSRQWTVRGWVE